MTSTPYHSGYRDDRTSPLYFCMCLCQCACASFHFVSFIHACVVFRSDWWQSVSKGDWRGSRGPKKDRWVYTVCSRILLEKLAVRQLVKKLSHFVELLCSSPCSQNTAICQCPVTNICIKTTPKTEFTVTCTLLLQLQYLITPHSWRHSSRNTRWRYCVNLPAYLRNIFVSVSSAVILLYWWSKQQVSMNHWYVASHPRMQYSV
jgi:hypothetical protein